MTKLAEAREILTALQIPTRQRTDMCCRVLLALAGQTNDTSWEESTNVWIGIHGITTFIRDEFEVEYAENTRETIRKQAIHNFQKAAFIENNGMPTNSPNFKYRLTEEMLTLVKSFHTSQWEDKLKSFLESHGSLIELYSSRRNLRKIPVAINGKNLTLSIGAHNELQTAVINEFAPRFTPGAQCLYLGDSTKRDLVKEDALMRQLGISMSIHDKLPDIILYLKEKNWLCFIEAVTSVGPMSPKRLSEIEAMTTGVTAKKLYITAFLDFRTYKKFLCEIAWETEVWIAEQPDHMVHHNGYKFLLL